MRSNEREGLQRQQTEMDDESNPGAHLFQHIWAYHIPQFSIKLSQLSDAVISNDGTCLKTTELLCEDASPAAADTKNRKSKGRGENSLC